MYRLKNEIESILAKIQIDFGGGCSLHKALIMSYLIQIFKMKATCDIGVYRGRSFFPQAKAHSLFTGGLVYGVDPFDNNIARENDNKILKLQIDDFLDRTELQSIFLDVITYRKEVNLNSFSELLRLPSKDAALFFKEKNIRFDMVHIDGNHDTKFVLNDIESYLPLLKIQGFMVLDDISWESVRPAYSKLKLEMYKVYELVDEWNDFAVFASKTSFMLKIRLYLLSKFKLL